MLEKELVLKGLVCDDTVCEDTVRIKGLFVKTLLDIDTKLCVLIN